MRDPYDPERLAESNIILATFLPDATLSIANASTNRPYITIAFPCWRQTQDGRRIDKVQRQAVIPNASGSGLSFAPGNLRFGGTAEEGIAQLIRFIRGRTRRPLAWWEDRFRDATYQAVLASSYAHDVAKLCCVLCGQPTDSHDWSGAGRPWRQGPCCALGVCRGVALPMMGGGTDAKDEDASESPGDSMDGRMIYRGTVVHE